MALSTIDARTALIVVDLQKGIAPMLPAETWKEVVGSSSKLAQAFRARKLPVVLVTVDAVPPGRTEASARLGPLPPGFADLVDELGARPGDILVTKRSWGAFATTDLEARLRSLNVTQVVVTGVATSAGVEATARQAYEAGLNVTLALDAMADRRAEAQEHSIVHVFPRLGETGTTADIIARLP